jgi:hypothetical protein
MAALLLDDASMHTAKARLQRAGSTPCRMEKTVLSDWSKSRPCLARSFPSLSPRLVHVEPEMRCSHYGLIDRLFPVAVAWGSRCHRS